MLTRRTLLAGVVVAILFGIAMARLYQFRFARGDIYLPYSSLRADPLGGKVWFDALREMPGLEVVRNFQRIEKIEGGEQTAIFYLGMPVRYFGRETDLLALDEAAQSGARVIVALKPEKNPPPADKKKPDQSRGEKTPEKPREGVRMAGLIRQRWQVRMDYLPEPAPWVAVGEGVEPGITGHSVPVFVPDDAVWRTIYRAAGKDGKPTLIERRRGKGSIVLCADSWLFSNEAMRTERVPALLTWMIAGKTRIVFDETHFGVRESPGIATLVRRFHLEGVFAVCLLLGLLFLWRHGIPLVPVSGPASTDTAVAGHDAASGLTNLLRRSIAPRDVLAVCMTQWKRTHRRPVPPSDLETVQALAADTAKSPLDRYRAIAKLLTTHVRRH